LIRQTETAKVGEGGILSDNGIQNDYMD